MFRATVTEHQMKVRSDKHINLKTKSTNYIATRINNKFHTPTKMWQKKKGKPEQELTEPVGPHWSRTKRPFTGLLKPMCLGPVEPVSFRCSLATSPRDARRWNHPTRPDPRSLSISHRSSSPHELTLER